MKKRGNISGSILAALLLGLALACTPLDRIPGTTGEDGRELVPVTFNLAVAPEEPATKGAFDPDEPGYDASTAIKTVTVLQFEKDEEGDGYTRVGNQVCYDYDDVLTGVENIPLVTSSRENIIFVIANATDPGLETIHLSGHGSLDDFLAGQNGNLLSSLGSLDGTGILYAPGGGADRYLRMSTAVKVDGVTLGTVLGTPSNPLYLKRNCAKVVVRVRNSSADPDKVTVGTVQLRDINRLYHYVANIPDGLPVAFTDPYSPQTPRRFDNDEEVFPVDYNVSGDTQTYTYLVPANLRGTVSNASQADKNRHAPQGATRFCVYATCGDPAKPVTYTYYLGANLTSDFNLAPNRKYEFTIDLQGRGDPGTDTRIEDESEVRFGLDANSYMLKPPARAGATKDFFIPVRRAAVFWNRTDTNMGLYGAGDGDPAYILKETDTWTAHLVWNQVNDADGNPVPDGDLLVTSSGTGFDPDNPGSQAFIQVRVASGMVGNAVVAIRKTSAPTNDDILWSWHLWVTDYDPYVRMAPLAGNYLYAVPGGEIHRYGGTNWASDEYYADAFMMDRNLGALVVVGDPKKPVPRNGLYYEWGRKDPLPHVIIVSGVEGNATGEQPTGAGVDTRLAKFNIRYGIRHPVQFISGVENGAWTTYEDEGPVLGAETAWMDPRINQHGADYCEPDKSVYDPCPYGWQVPKHGTWSDFNSATTEFDKASAPEGLYYYPEGYDPLAPKGRILIPASGIKGYYWTAGSTNDIGTGGRLWSCTPVSNDVNRAQTYVFGGGWYWNMNYHNCKGNGLVVRCIRLGYRLPY